MNSIQRLIPQRHPFLFVDTILTADKERIVGIKNFPASFIFTYNDSLAGKIIPPGILIETLVQCGGAGAAQLGLVGQQLMGLAALEKVTFYGAVRPGDSVKLVVKNLKVSPKILKQAGSAWVVEKPVLQALWTCLAVDFAAPARD